MPSSPNYKRNYKQEAAAESKDRRHQRSERVQARRELIREGRVKVGDGKDVDHKTPLSRGGSNSLANLRVVDPHTNRSYPRNKDGSMKRKTK